jgi:hypothetical protein
MFGSPSANCRGISAVVRFELFVLERLVPKAKVVIGAMPSQFRSSILRHFRQH